MTVSFIKVRFVVLALFLITITTAGFAQQFQPPRSSPKAVITQTVGVTDVTINYCRPGVKGRVVWGELVPYGQIWRTGANEVTSIVISDDVKVNGNLLKAGTYGIHTMPGKDEWDVIFSGNTKVGGGSNFVKENEVLRLKIKPQMNQHVERMQFTFDDVDEKSAIVSLAWEKLKVSFKIETETQEQTLAKARKSVDWGTPMSAAQYCLQNNVNLDEAMSWINASTMINENYWNMRIKAQLQAKLGNKNDAVATLQKAIEHGSKMESAPFDFDAMKKLLADWKM
ncbi:MAG: DUF2911 domain-containing protein [Ignavibacteriales bacterium]|nr:MAG: DUF2911 domain-containing protein [Ignavibacteriales bacterium]